MEFKEEFEFVNGKLDVLMAYDLISGGDYIALSKKLLQAEDRLELLDIMTWMRTAAITTQMKKDEEKQKREEERKRKRG